MQSNILQAALKYAEQLHWSVIPISPNTKIPPKGFEVIPFRERIASREEIESWWRENPRYNVGIITGKLSKLLAIDHDKYKPEYSEEKALEYIPDNIITPTSSTPRGGLHQLFSFPEVEISIGTAFSPAMDYRGEGGYIVAPPSVNGNGKGYEWLIRPGEVELATLPSALLSALINNNNGFIYRGGCQERQHLTTNDNNDNIFRDGKRDESLFHIALSLAKTGNSEDYIRQTLAAIMLSWGETDEIWISAKVQSAFKRLATKDRNLTAEIREWVMTTFGNFLTTDVNIGQHLTTREEKKKAGVILGRLVDEGILERYGNKNGCFRRIETDIEPVNFLTAPTDEFSITWPMDIHDHCILYPGNVIIVAGSKGAGKTSFLLNTVRLNMNQHDIVYLNSEMGDTEFRKRLELFEDVPLSSWKMKPYHRASNFSDLITPEKKIFIVDYLEVTTDFWKVAQYIQEIHKKLKQGICIIALQKSEGRDAGRGGDFSKEKARLYLSLDYLHDEKMNRIKITDAKAWRTDRNPRGMYRTYKLVKGSKFIPQGYWRD